MDDCFCTGGIIEKLKQAIPDNTPYTWNPLPECKSPVELAMIRVNRKEEQQPNTERLKNRVLGNYEEIMNSPGVVEVKVYEIFDSGLFKDDGLIVLLQGGPGMGKTTLGYSYCKKWKDGGLHEFDMAAFVSLRETDKEKEATFDDLLFLACGNDEVMKAELKHSVKSGTSLLLVLDGWDEAPDIVRNSPGTFICMLQRSIPSQSKSKVLITSRPDSSVDLDVNRVEIVGFTKDSIKEYFKEALRSSLNDKHEVEVGCKELQNHLEAHPPIQSCCAIPLNAAIVARLFLASDKTLPRTRRELFSSIVAHLINKEKEKHCSASAYKKGYNNISHLEVLADSLKKPLCRLAFDNLKEIVIPHEMVASTQLVEHGSANPNDANFNSTMPILSPCLRAVLQAVEKRDPKSGGMIYYYHFIHLSIQELLAAYHISQMGEDEQVKVFQDLLDEPRFSSVLQFYAAFTRFTNQGVQNMVTRIDLANKKHILLTVMRCCFEANCQDQLLYQKIIPRLNGRLSFYAVPLTPFDCMSVGYFLAFALRTGELLCVDLQGCSIDDHSLGLLLGELFRHGKACPVGVLQGVTCLNIIRNNIGDDGITRLATALQANTTMKELAIDFNCGITGNGAEFLGRGLSVNSSLEELYISFTSIGDEGVAHIANALQTNTTMKVLNVSKCGISCKGAESLARALSVNSSLEKLKITFNILSDNGKAHIATARQANSTLKSLSLDDDSCIETDKAALSLGAALTTNTSMKVMRLGWTSTHPDTTLKKMAECIKKSTLKQLTLTIDIPHAFGEPRVSLEEAREWLHRLEVGGKEFILSLEDSCLEMFLLAHRTIKDDKQYFMEDSVLHVPYLTSQIKMSFNEAAASVNMTRKMNYLPEINFDIYVS